MIKIQTISLFAGLFGAVMPVFGQLTLVTENASADEVTVAGDLLVQGDGDATDASLEVSGDAVITGNHHVDGDLILNGNDFNPGEYLKKGYTSPRSGFLGNDFYSVDIDNFLFLADRRFAVTQTGFDDPRIHELFDGEFDSNSSGNRIYSGDSAIITLDLLAKSEYGSYGVTYPIGNIYVTSYSNHVPSNVSVRYWTRNNVIVTAGTMEDVPGNGRLWKFSIPHLGSGIYMTKLEVTIDGPTSGFAAIEEIEYHLNRQKNEHQRPYVSKYVAESLYKTLSFRNVNNLSTVTIRPDTGKITAVDLELSGDFLTPNGGTYYHSGNFPTTVDTSDNIELNNPLAFDSAPTTSNNIVLHNHALISSIGESGTFDITGDNVDFVHHMDADNSNQLGRWRFFSDSSLTDTVPNSILEAGAIHLNGLNANEEVFLSLVGTKSNYNVTVQDGSGRALHYWNAAPVNSNGENLYLHSSENAGRLRFHPYPGDVDPFGVSINLFSIANAPAGTAGSPITWTERFVVDHDGNVGIGVDAPTEKLEVDGAVVLGISAGDTEGAIRYDGVAKKFEGHDGSSWKSLSSESSGSAHILTTPNQLTDVITVAADGSIRITPDGVNEVFSITSDGAVVMAEQGDISMGAFGTE